MPPGLGAVKNAEVGRLVYRGRALPLAVRVLGGGLASVLSLGLLSPLALWLLADHLCRNLELDGAPFVFKARRGELYLEFVRLLLGTLLTLGLYGPWALARGQRWLAERVEHRGRPLTFVGDGLGLLLVHGFGLTLTLVSLGLLAPWYLLEVLRFNLEHTVVGSRRLSLDAPALAFWGRAWLEILATVATFGLWLPWALHRELGWLSAHAGAVPATHAPRLGVRAPVIAVACLVFSGAFLLAARHRERLPLERLEDALYRRARAVVVTDAPAPGGRAAGAGASGQAEDASPPPRSEHTTHAAETPPEGAQDLACCSAPAAPEPPLRALVDPDGSLVITNRAAE